MASVITRCICSKTAFPVMNVLSKRLIHSEECCGNVIGNKVDPQCKVAIVTGGTSGIGYSAASELLAAGARNVVITGLTGERGKAASQSLNARYGRDKALFINADVKSMAQFEEVFIATMELYSKIDILVNCAGICDGNKWEEEITTNIVGTIRGVLLAYRYMSSQGLGCGGTVVNIAGIMGVEPFPVAPTLAATKHAIVGLSKSFGAPQHFKRTKVRVMALCPGLTQTASLKSIMEKGMTSGLLRITDRDLQKAVKQKPDSVGQAVVHLVKHGSSGSVWIIEDAQLFKLTIPEKNCCAKLSAQFH